MSKDLQFDLKKSESAQMSVQDKRNMRAMMKKIEDATGVNRLEDVLQKVLKHEETTSTLLDMQKALQSKLYMLYAKRDNLSAQVEECQGSGVFVGSST